MALSAHFWTLATRIRPAVPEPPPRPWSIGVEDGLLGEVRLTGLLREEPGSQDVLVVAHGIGGCASAKYAVAMARAAHLAGVSCLRVNLRGCDRLGGDYYHAGLSSDLGAAIASPALAGYRRVLLMGFSMGGHLSLHYATGATDPRLGAVAAVCSPLDLAPAAARIDTPSKWAYRRFVLRNLIDIYRAVALRRDVPVPIRIAERFTLLREWDEQVVSPRWGFRGADDYYASASVAPRLGALRAPALLVAAEEDPIIPSEVLRPVLSRHGQSLEARWVDRGGHVGFPASLDLGEDAPLGLEAQVLGWLLRQNRHQRLCLASSNRL